MHSCRLKRFYRKFFKENPDFADLVELYDFQEISDENLAKILNQKLLQSGFIFDENVSKNFLACVQKSKNDSSCIYKNGWIVEKEIIKKILQNQAARLSKNQNLTKTDLKTILADDLPAKATQISPDEILSELDSLVGIDEVYTLSKDDFGREATDTLMKRMEDDRGKFIVVVAGYEDKMQDWLATNPGLSSRFNYKFHLDDYNPDELFELFDLYAKKENLILTDGAKKIAKEKIQEISENKDENFANGRTIRNFFDSVVRHKNSRVVSLPQNQITKQVLLTITNEDF